jgi:hypothetical protein
MFMRERNSQAGPWRAEVRKVLERRRAGRTNLRIAGKCLTMLRLASHPQFSLDHFKPALREAFSTATDK